MVYFSNYVTVAPEGTFGMQELELHLAQGPCEGFLNGVHESQR